MTVLYVIRSPMGRRKIGYTINLEQRLKDITRSNHVDELGEFVCEFAEECDSTMARALEQHIHAMLWLRRVRGEWFWCSLDLARETIFAAKMSAEIGALIKPPGSVQSSEPLWQGEGRYIRGTEAERDFRAMERKRIASENQKAGARVAWIKRRAHF